MRFPKDGLFEMRSPEKGLFEMYVPEDSPFEMRVLEEGPSQIASPEVKPQAFLFLSFTTLIVTANNHSEHGGNVSSWFPQLCVFKLSDIGQAHRCFRWKFTLFVPARVFS